MVNRNSEEQKDRHFMKCALKEAKKALSENEVPVGAVIVCENKIIARGHNRTLQKQCPTAHAEIIAIQKAAKKMKQWRLPDAILYVTLEPCSMCAGAMVLARIKKLVYGLKDPKSGGCGSVLNIVQNSDLNHRMDVMPGIEAEESLSLLQTFFRQKRQNKTK